MDKIDTLKKFLSNIPQYISNGIHWITINKGLSIFFPTLLLMIFDDWIKWLSAGIGLYGMILLRELLNHKIEKDTLDSLDIHYFESANNNLEDPLDGYIDMCINEYMVLNRGYKVQQGYINTKEESLIHKEVLDLLASNMSPLMKKKFEMYYGTGQVEPLMARKSFIKVSLYVANNNKALYETGASKDQDMEKIFRAMMMTNDKNSNMMR